MVSLNIMLLFEGDGRRGRLNIAAPSCLAGCGFWVWMQLSLPPQLKGIWANVCGSLGRMQSCFVPVPRFLDAQEMAMLP